MCQYATVFSSYYGDKRYDFPITPERLAKSPPWLEEQPNPPLPARSALATALGYLGTLFPDAGRWKPAAITLVPVRDRWCIRLSSTNCDGADAPSVFLRLSGSW